jgi:hypothetical protein
VLHATAVRMFKQVSCVSGVVWRVAFPCGDSHGPACGQAVNVCVFLGVLLLVVQCALGWGGACI